MRQLAPEERPIADLLGLPYTVSAGAHQGCGCGFRYSAEDEDLSRAKADAAAMHHATEEMRQQTLDAAALSREDSLRGRESVRALRDYLRTLVQHGPVAIYPHWADDPLTRSRVVQITPEIFEPDADQFEIGDYQEQVLEISANSDS